MFKLPQTDVTFLRKILDEKESAGIVTKSSSNWSSPMFVVWRNSHDPAKAKGRAVVDFRKLNKFCEDDLWPLPDLLLCLDQLAQATYFGALDLKSGFWQVPVHHEDTKKFAFITPLGLHEYLRVPMGYKNAPSVFMRLIDTLID